MRLLFEDHPDERRARALLEPLHALAQLPARRARPARARRAGVDPPVGVGPRQRRGVGRPAVARPARGDGRAPARHRLGGRRGAARPRALPPLPHAGPPGHRRGVGPARARPHRRASGCSTPASRRSSRAPASISLTWRSGWASARMAEESRVRGRARGRGAPRAGRLRRLDRRGGRRRRVAAAGHERRLGTRPARARARPTSRSRRAGRWCSTARSRRGTACARSTGRIRSARRATTGAAPCGPTSPGWPRSGSGAPRRRARRAHAGRAHAARRRRRRHARVLLAGIRPRAGGARLHVDGGAVPSCRVPGPRLSHDGDRAASDDRRRALVQGALPAHARARRAVHHAQRRAGRARSTRRTTSGRSTSGSASPASSRSRAACTRRCTAAGCGRCASSPASARRRRPTSASATCSTTARRASRPRSTCRR